MSGWLRGLSIRVGVALVTSVVAAYTACLPSSSSWWVKGVAEALNRPIILVWNRFHPTWDTYPPFYPIDTLPSLVAFLVFALPIFTILAYLPTVAAWVIRITHSALHAPSAFVIYLLAGSALGGMLGIRLWAASSYIYTPGTLRLFVLIVALAIGWGLGVGRSHVALRHHE